MYLIGGPMGIGKTTVARILADRLPRAVYFDGDWAWDLHPFTVNAETIKMAHENIAFLLKNFLMNRQIENVVFTWVLHEQTIIDRLLTDLSDCEFQLFNISLISDEATLTQHFLTDKRRNPDDLARTLSYLPKYEKINTVKFDRTGKTADAICDEILRWFQRKKDVSTDRIERKKMNG